MTLNWICEDCGKAYGNMPKDHIATWHNGRCDFCYLDKAVTEPRDFGISFWSPKLTEEEKKEQDEYIKRHNCPF